MAMQKIRDLVARLRIVPDRKANEEAEKEVQAGFGRMEGWAKKIGAAIGVAFAVDKILDFGRMLVRTAREAEVPWNRLEQTINNAGGSFDRLEQRIKLAARAMQDTTRVGDEEFAETLNRLISLTDDVNRSFAAMPLVADVAAKFFKGDLAPAADLVGRALTGNVRQLRQLGINTKDAEEGLRILAERSKGAAQNELSTLDGKVAALKNDLGDLAEAGGNALIKLGSRAIEAVVPFVTMRKAIQSLTEGLERLAESSEERTKRIRSALGEDELTDLRKAGVNIDVLLGGSKPGEDPVEAARKREAALDKEISSLSEGFKLQTLKNAEIMRAMDLEARYVEEIRAGNLELDERNKIERRLQQLREITRHHVEFGNVSPFMTDAPAPGMATGFMTGIRGADDRDPPQILHQDAVDRARERLRDIEDAGTNAAFGVAGAWQDSFTLLIDGMGNVGEAAETLGRGMLGALAGGLAQYASGKVKENIAASFEEVAKGIAASANPFLAATAPAHFTAAAKHAGAAALWGVLAGGAGAGQSAIAGGGRGGFSGGVPGGSTDADARRFDFERGPQTIIYVDGFSPGNPVHVQLLGQGIKKVAASDSSVEVRPRNGA